MTRRLRLRILAIAAMYGLVTALPVAAQTPADGGADSRMPGPQPDECITDVSAGDHRFMCSGMMFRVMVDDGCLEKSCGLIFDIHGAGMTADMMRANTELHELAPPNGYLVVQPSASPDGPGSWSYNESGAAMNDFMDRMVRAFSVDEDRIHVTGFSMGAAMTFWFLCNHNERLASVSVATGSSADQVRTPDGLRKCIDAIDEDWSPRVPILFMNGVKDPALTEAAAQARTDGIVERLGLTGGDVVASGAHFERRHWAGDNGMAFDFVTHNYAAEGRLAGHCMPGGKVVNATTCATEDNGLHWGRISLDWFQNHPRR